MAKKRTGTKVAKGSAASKSAKVTKEAIKATKKAPRYEDEESLQSESDGARADSDDEPDSEDDDHNKSFTDDNKNWLKIKGTKTSHQSDEEDEEDDEEMDEIERQAMQIDAEKELEAKEAEEELQRERSDKNSKFHLPTAEELALDEDRVVPPSELRDRIESIISVLSNFKFDREEGRSRSDYTTQLEADLSDYFGYLPELIALFLKMFGPKEALEFLDASDKPRPLVIRTNTLKARRKDLAQALIKRGINLDPLSNWSKVGLKIYESTVPVGATPEYLAGHYMLQSAASMCPVMSLSPLPGERVLDMSAAPGGKTTYIAQLMKNQGVIVANDLKAERQKATVANLHRLGVRNVIAVCNDGTKYPKVMGNFDRVLLDAPCSGLGVISRDQSIKVQRTVQDIERTAHLQKKLLLAAVDAVNPKSKTGGYIVYSTCSVSVQENEQVVQYMLGKRDVKLVDAGLPFGNEGYTRYQERRFHPSLKMTRRFYPHVHNMDGFYVAKFKKISNRKLEDTDKEVEGGGGGKKGEKGRVEEEEEVVVEGEGGESEEGDFGDAELVIDDDDFDDEDEQSESEEEGLTSEQKKLRAKYMTGKVLPSDDESVDSDTVEGEGKTKSKQKAGKKRPPEEERKDEGGKKKKGKKGKKGKGGNKR
ncbi:hypothetical protein TrCOL_g309 [Triparma columacea]|uniref:SAM-dependent MTase RsmB/NOP-type domain-containing protein n=1 Tax=Triparma columacea TaxID=722753 RepID=A0A9W7GLV4_9STRA|nr:hypothetical protein TrCOL_g309 [Triparma columacea]